MTTSRSEQELREELSAFEKKFKRRLVPFVELNVGTLYCVYAEEALSGFLAHVEKDATFGKFNEQPALLFPFTDWTVMRTFADRAVVSSLILVKGKELKVGFWMPQSGMKYAVRDVDGIPMTHVLATEFKDVG